MNLTSSNPLFCVPYKMKSLLQIFDWKKLQKIYLHHRCQEGCKIYSKFSLSKDRSMWTYLVSASHIRPRYGSEYRSDRLKNLAMPPPYTRVKTSADTSNLFKHCDGCLDMSESPFEGYMKRSWVSGSSELCTTRKKALWKGSWAINTSPFPTDCCNLQCLSALSPIKLAVSCPVFPSPPATTNLLLISILSLFKPSLYPLVQLTKKISKLSTPFSLSLNAFTLSNHISSQFSFCSS